MVELRAKRLTTSPTLSVLHLTRSFPVLAGRAAANVSCVPTTRFSFERTSHPGVASASCKEFNAVMSKPGAELILQAALGILVESDLVDEQDTRFLDSIVEATLVPSIAQIDVEKD